MSRSGQRPIKYRRNTPPWFKDRLKRLALEINSEAVTAAKHQRKAVLHALKVGARLNAARRLLQAWAERARRVREYDPPPRWGAWLKQNFQGSRQTADLYRELDRGRYLIEDRLKDPDVTITELIAFLRNVRFNERLTEALAAGGREGGPAGEDEDDGPASSPRRLALNKLLTTLREAARRWGTEELVFLAAHCEEFHDAFDNFAFQLKPLAKPWLRWATRKGDLTADVNAGELDAAAADHQGALVDKFFARCLWRAFVRQGGRMGQEARCILVDLINRAGPQYLDPDDRGRFEELWRTTDPDWYAEVKGPRPTSPPPPPAGKQRRKRAETPEPAGLFARARNRPTP
jgi:hypothetical protein